MGRAASRKSSHVVRLITFLFVLFILFGLSTASGSTTGSISGVVYETGTTTPIADIVIEVYQAGYSDWGYTITDEDGKYSVSGLSAGDYYVNAYPGAGQNYISEYYNNAASSDDADLVTISSGENKTGIDFYLDIGATISGGVYEIDGTTPIEGIYIEAYSDACDGYSSYLGYAFTDETGAYTIAGLPTGDVYLQTYVLSTLNYISEWYDNGDGATDCSGAAAISVTAGVDYPTPVNFSLAEGATISGTVYESDGTTPIEGIYVEAFSDACDGYFSYLGSAVTDETGAYTIIGLSTGDVYLQAYVETYSFFSTTPLNFISEWYDGEDGTTDCSGAAAISVTEGVDYPTPINFSLDEGATISGTVYESDGTTPIEGIYVEAYSDACDVFSSYLGYATTDENGAYTIVGLSTGDVYLFATSYFSDVSYFDEYYGGATDCSGAEVIEVTAGNDYEDKDFQLDRAGSISGTIYESDGVTPIAYAMVVAISDPGNTDPGAPKLCTTISDAYGEYTLSSLSSGNVYVYTYGTDDEDAGYIRSWYNNALSKDEATSVAVVVGYDAGGIDFKLYPDTDSDGDGMPDQWEIAYFGDLSNDGTGDSDSDGVRDVDEYNNGTSPKELYTVDESGGVDTAADDDDGGGGGCFISNLF